MTNKEFHIAGKHKKPILIDVTYEDTKKNQPIVVFCHGYKGFKDWGAWHLIAEEFAKAGFFFLKFNFSHNGGTLKQPIDFPDLEAFGNDNYSKQLDDLGSVLDWTEEANKYSDFINPHQISLIGHSRGGGISLLKTKEDQRIKKLVTWAGVSNFQYRFPKGKALEEWKQKGVYYVKNGRTKQDMPHFYQFYEDYIENKERFNFKAALKHLQIPYLIIHGTADETVNNKEAEFLFDQSDAAKMKWIAGANHVFSMQHPWSETSLPEEARELVMASIDFFRSQNE